MGIVFYLMAPLFIIFIQGVNIGPAILVKLQGGVECSAVLGGDCGIGYTYCKHKYRRRSQFFGLLGRSVNICI